METQTQLAPGYWALDEHGNVWPLCNTHAYYFARDNGLDWETFTMWGGPARGYAGNWEEAPAVSPFEIGAEFDTPPACTDCQCYLEGSLTGHGRAYVRAEFLPELWQLWGVEPLCAEQAREIYGGSYADYIAEHHAELLAKGHISLEDYRHQTLGACLVGNDGV